MFYFGIPLRSRDSSRDWEQVCERFRNTIRSVTRQTASEFTVLVACHQTPELCGVQDSRVRFIQAPFAPPTRDDFLGQMVDKSRKVHFILTHIKRLGVGYYMQVDADDLVSKRIVEFVQSNPEVAGWRIRQGFQYRVGCNFVQPNPAIACGSTQIVRVEDGDLPLDMSDADSPDAPMKYVLRRAHGTWDHHFAELGRPFRTLPFAGCIYVTGYSDNHSFNKPWRSRLNFRNLVLAVSPRIPLNDAIRDEFGL